MNFKTVFTTEQLSLLNVANYTTVISVRNCYFRVHTAHLHVPRTTSSFGIVEWHNEARESTETTMIWRLTRALSRGANADWAQLPQVHRHWQRPWGPQKRRKRWRHPVKWGHPGPPDLSVISKSPASTIGQLPRHQLSYFART